MNVQELVNLIDEKVKLCKAPNEIYDLPQPEEWIKKQKSITDNTEFDYNDIELIEALMNRMFSEWYYDIVYSPLIVQDKNGLSVTVTVKLFYGTGMTMEYKYGIATEYVSNIKVLTLATPKATSMAFKNAAKKIGRLFGANLNRGLYDSILPEIQIEKEPIDRAEKRYKILIDDCKTVDALITYQYVIPASLKEYYNEKIKQLKK